MKDLLLELMVSGQSVVMWALTALATFVSAKIIQSIKNDKLKQIMQRLWDEVNAAVKEVFQTYVAAIKAGKADGKLTDEEKTKAKDLALAAVKANLGKKGLGALARIVGLDSLDKYLGGKIEAAVADAKLAGTFAGSKTTGTAITAGAGAARPL